MAFSGGSGRGGGDFITGEADYRLIAEYASANKFKRCIYLTTRVILIECFCPSAVHASCFNFHERPTACTQSETAKRRC